MLVLFETPAGYALFKVLDKGLVKNPDNIWKSFETPDAAAKAVKLKTFHKFADTSKALAAASAICDGKLDKTLKKFLKKAVVDKQISAKIGVVDTKLGGLIKDKLGLECVYDNTVLELIRGIRNQMDSLIADQSAMKLGLSHSLCRYKLKFSPDKVDVMIIQAIALLDELDKELNTYVMRVREWYGWHFPELSKIIQDHQQFAKVVKLMGVRTMAAKLDFSEILTEELEKELKEAAEISMGTEIADEDVDNIRALCDQVISLAEYRTSLYDYLRNRMNAIAPNLTCMVGELVGARLIAHAGSLMSLAKHPASTVQILGAEKALFRALKTKHDTPKYGLIYHASLVGQAAPKFKGKISRVLAAKTALSIRMDALGDSDGITIGLEARAKVEDRLRQLEGGKVRAMSGAGKAKSKQEKYVKPEAPVAGYNEVADAPMDVGEKKKKKKDKEKNGAAVGPAGEDLDAKAAKKAAKKRAREEAAGEGVPPVKKEKKAKKAKTEPAS